MLANATSGSVSASSVGSQQYVDYYYENENSIDTQSCYGYIQATYTSDGGASQASPTQCCLPERCNK